MLHLYLTQPFNPNYELDIDAWFETCADYSWLEDPLCKKWIKQIDASDVVSCNLIQSPVLGPIPPQWLSGGVKMLIGLYKTDDKFDLRSCGEDCSDIILDIAEIKDIFCACSYAMRFDVSNTRPIMIDNDNTLVVSLDELYDSYGRYDIW